MCLLGCVAKPEAQHFDLVICFNRDVPQTRPMEGLSAWSDRPIIAARDPPSGGTCLALNYQTGRLAAILNYDDRVDDLVSNPTECRAASRGKLCLEMASAKPDESIDIPQWKLYTGFNMVLMDLFEPAPWKEGTRVLTNRPLRCWCATSANLDKKHWHVASSHLVDSTSCNDVLTSNVPMWTVPFSREKRRVAVRRLGVGNGSLFVNDHGPKVNHLLCGVQKTIEEFDTEHPKPCLNGREEWTNLAKELASRLANGVMSDTSRPPPHEDFPSPLLENFKPGTYTDAHELNLCQRVMVTGLENWATVSQTVILRSRTGLEERSQIVWVLERRAFHGADNGTVSFSNWTVFAVSPSDGILGDKVEHNARDSKSSLHKNI